MNQISPKYIFKAVQKHAVDKPSKSAVIDTKGRTLTYQELYKSALAVANDLLARGLNRGDRVLVTAGKEALFPAQYLGIHIAEGIAVPLDSQIPEERRDLIQALCNPRYSLSEDGFEDLSKVDASKCLKSSILSPNQPADLLFTTGTTGMPKGVLLSHQNLVASVQNINAYIGTCGDDIEVIALPLSHSFGLGRMRCLLWVGGTMVLTPGFERPKRLFDAMEKYAATGFSMVPAAWQLLHSLSGKRISSFAKYLRYVEFGSAPMKREHKELIAQLLPNTRICMHYGLTEASRAAFQEFHEDFGFLDSIGRPGPYVDISLKSDDGTIVPRGDLGELCIRGEMVMREYWNDPELTARSFFGDWFRTGDLGYQDEQGNFYIHGRVSEIINVGGQKVSPAEVEEALLKIDGICDAGCTSVMDAVAGEAVCAFIVVTNDFLTDSDIKNQLKVRLEPYKIPVSIVRTKNIPRTNSGKIQRQYLKYPPDKPES